MSTQTKSTLKLLLVIIGMSMYVLLLLCYLSTDSAIIETMFLSSCLVLALSIVVSYFTSTMYYDNDTTNTPYDYTEHIEYECTGAHVYEDLEQRMIMIPYNTQEDEDTLPY